MFISESRDDKGDLYIFRTDDEGEFIKHAIQTMFFEPEHRHHVTVTAQGDRWYRITIDLSHLRSDDEALFSAMSDLDIIFGPFGKGWYENRAEAHDESRLIQSYEVRHRGGPYI